MSQEVNLIKLRINYKIQKKIFNIKNNKKMIYQKIKLMNFNNYIIIKNKFYKLTFNKRKNKIKKLKYKIKKIHN